jgi:hypothetical protein
VGLQPLRGSLASWTPGARGTADPLHAVSAVWPAIVGPDVAANCAPIALAHGTLTIATRSSAWSQQLQFLTVAIVRGVGEHAPGAAVERIVFRAGAFRERERRGRPPSAAAAARRRGDASAYEPASDLADAFERVRARIRAARRATRVACSVCGAPLPADDAPRPCTACAIATARERALDLERLVYAAPWLTFEELREALPRLTVTEYEDARRRLLARWSLVLKRALVAGSARAGALERSIASSYVLLQSRLAPDRITPAVVANSLGAEVARVLFGERAALPESASEAPRRS